MPCKDLTCMPGSRMLSLSLLSGLVAIAAKIDGSNATELYWIGISPERDDVT
jgi:hypothetical protein